MRQFASSSPSVELGNLDIFQLAVQKTLGHNQTESVTLQRLELGGSSRYGSAASFFKKFSFAQELF